MQHKQPPHECGHSPCCHAHTSSLCPPRRLQNDSNRGGKRPAAPRVGLSRPTPVLTRAESIAAKRRRGEDGDGLAATGSGALQRTVSTA